MPSPLPQQVAFHPSIIALYHRTLSSHNRSSASTVSSLPSSFVQTGAEMTETAPKSGALAAYPAGHHKAVLASHLSRNAHNSAAHLLPHLKPGMSILDIGCGPGTISTSFGGIVGPSGRVVGVDPSESVIETAIETAGGSYPNVTFQVGDGSNLPFEDGTFDVVHAHQVLQHTTQAVQMLKEMRRVARKPGGIVSLREADATSTTIWPHQPRIDYLFKELYPKVASSGGADPLTGRKLHILLREAGFSKDEVTITAGTHLYGVNNLAEAEWWSSSWADRVAAEGSGFGKTAIEKGFASQEELDAIADAWREWGKSEDAWYAMLDGEAICRVYR